MTIQTTSFAGVSGTLEGTLLTLKGPKGSLDGIREVLTIQDKKALFRLEQLKNQKPKSEKHAAWIRAEIATVKTQVTEEYYEDLADGSGLQTMPGFWWMASQVTKNEHLNTILKYVDPALYGGRIPRPYQIEAVQEILKYKRASISAFTGAGKSLILLMITMSAVKSQKRVCIITPNIELMKQMLATIKTVHSNVSGLGGNLSYKPGCDVLVTTVQSARGYIDSFDVILCDEMHHNPAKSFMEVLAAASKATHVYGLTATWSRNDGTDALLSAFTGPVVYSRDVKWGIDNGYLTPLDVISYVIHGAPRCHSGMNGMIAYNKIMTSPVITHELFLMVKKLNQAKKKTLVLFRNVKAGLAFKDYCAKAELEIEVASSKFRGPFYAFKEDKSNLLISTHSLLGEGIDIPRLDVVINATQLGSEGLTKQIVGRVLRLSEGKKRALLIDISVGNVFAQFLGCYYKRKKLYSEITSVKELIK